jgi:midasin
MSDTKITLIVTSKDFPENYNFYEDPYFTEIKLVYAPMIKIIHRSLVLLEDWGDHPILVDVVTYCNKVLSFHCYKTPLQKVLTGLELILQKLLEYSKIASKLNSVQDQVNTCKLLIIRYRKIQIVSWRQMMNSKLEHALVEDYDNFIHLTYALNTEVIKEGEMEYDKIFDAVDMYVRDSNLSQFANRLLHINILRDQMDTINKKGVSNILHFVYMYYKQMEDKHQKVMKELQKDTEEKVKTVIDVSKWSVQKFETVSFHYFNPVIVNCWKSIQTTEQSNDLLL